MNAIEAEREGSKREREREREREEEEDEIMANQTGKQRTDWNRGHGKGNRNLSIKNVKVEK